MGALLAFLSLRPGCTPDEKAEPQTGVRQPVLRRESSPHAQKATSECRFEKKYEEKKNNDNNAGEGTLQVRSLRERLCYQTPHSWSDCHHFVDFPALISSPLSFLFVGFYFHSQKKKRKIRKKRKKNLFRLQKHFLADDKPHFQWAVYFHISLAADILPSFFFFFGGDMGPKYFEASKCLKQQQPPGGEQEDSAAKSVINKGSGQ